MYQIRSLLLSVLVLFSVCVNAQENMKTPEPPPKQPSATVYINETQYALILGGSTGTGVLTYKNRDYPFTLNGLSIGANVGISKMTATGEVYDLNDVTKFAGQYSVIESALTLGMGGAGTVLKNEHGVLMNLTSSTEGLQLNLSAGGVKVEFAR